MLDLVQLLDLCITSLKSFRFKDEDDYEYEIRRKVFSRILKI